MPSVGRAILVRLQWPKPLICGILRRYRSGALLRCLVGRLWWAAGLVRELRLRRRVEDRLALVPGELEGQPQVHAAAVIIRVLLDGLLQRLRRVFVPRQLIVAGLVGAGELHPEMSPFPFR